MNPDNLTIMPDDVQDMAIRRQRLFNKVHGVLGKLLSKNVAWGQSSKFVTNLTNYHVVELNSMDIGDLEDHLLSLLDQGI